MQYLLDHLQNPDNPELSQILHQQFQTDPGNAPAIPKEVSDKLLTLIHRKIKPEEIKHRPKVISLRAIGIAASILGIVVVATFLLLNKNGSKQVVKTKAGDHKFKNDVDPGGNKATLTLADGSVILLDEAKNGVLAQQGAAKVIKLDGKLLYDPAFDSRGQMVYNRISTPKGGQYQLELPDGSLVWLNATSSIRFPTSFTEKERRVEITGEAYLEVAKKPGKPFVVTVNSSEIQVLGTHFNINAYGDEDNLRTTLLEGSIKFVNGNTSHILHPGQQSQLTKDRTVNVVSKVDVDDVIAWKNGLFSFENAGIEAIMRQLARWYDVDVDFRGRTDDLFIAEMNRNIKLSDVLTALELTGKIRFEIEGKKIIVMP
jgi:ferric-dicitrate binding protein FerR (iron transport regulator)